MGVTFKIDYPVEFSWPNQRMSEDEFFEMCADNPKIPFERDAKGTIVIMPPTGDIGSRREASIILELGIWNRRAAAGYVFSSNGAVTLPNKAVRSPDGFWISKARFDALAEEDREKFAHIAPDFVAEIVSNSDSLIETKRKMEEYIANGVRLGFLLHPARRVAWVYRADGSMSEHSFEETLSGEDVMPGFELPLSLFV